MKDMRIPEQRKRGRKPGEPQLYNETTLCRSFCLTPAVIAALRRDMNTRNLIEDTVDWSLGRVAMDILSRHYGLDISRNGGEAS